MISDELRTCVFFTAGMLHRMMSKLAEESFARTGLSSSHAFILLLIGETPGINPAEVARQMAITPSTTTRFLDKLEDRGLIERKADGKIVHLFLTTKADELAPLIQQAWTELYARYSQALGQKAGDDLARVLGDAALSIHQSMSGHENPSSD